MNRVIQNLQCVKCARRFVLQGNGLLIGNSFAHTGSTRLVRFQLMRISQECGFENMHNSLEKWIFWPFPLIS